MKDPLQDLSETYQLGIGILLLLIATQLVILVLNRLEERQFGPVFLGTLVTPLCTGFPNLVIGLFGQERLQGDLVLQLNIGNNIANTTLVTGLILVLAGPLIVKPGKGRSKKSKRQNSDHLLALVFLWLGSAAIFWAAGDGRFARTDGILLTGLYVLYHLIGYKRRGRVPKKKRLNGSMGFVIFVLLAVATVLIHYAVVLIGRALDQVGDRFPGWHLGLFLGLLTVIPECFLLLRLALKNGSLGFSGLVGDCLVSVPLVVGLSSLVRPFETMPVRGLTDTAALPYLALWGTMAAFTALAFRNGPVPRKAGLFLMALYAIVWWQLQG